MYRRSNKPSWREKSREAIHDHLKEPRFGKVRGAQDLYSPVSVNPKSFAPGRKHDGSKVLLAAHGKNTASPKPMHGAHESSHEEEPRRRNGPRTSRIRFSDLSATQDSSYDAFAQSFQSENSMYEDAVSDFERQKSQGRSMRSHPSEARCFRQQMDKSGRSSKSDKSNKSNKSNKSPKGSNACSKNSKKKLDQKVFALCMELIEQVSKGRLELAEKMIEKGGNPNFADYDKRTPLHLAASEGHTDLVKMLLRYGATPDAKDRWGSKPYDDAVKNEFNEIADILRAYGEPDEEVTLGKDHHNGLELLEYSARGFEDMVHNMIKAGAKATFADYDRRTALHLAASEGHGNIVEILLRNGADATFKDRFGNTPVDDAMHNGFLDVLEIMHKRGVKIPEHIFDKSCTAEFRRNMRLIDASARGKIGRVQKLLKEGADPTFGDYDKRTPLHLACAEGHLAIVRLLIAAGADVSAEDRWHATAFEEATKYEHEAVVRYLESNATSYAASPVTSVL